MAKENRYIGWGLGKNMINLDIFVSLFWFFLGIFVSINSTQIGIGKLNEPGPGFIFFVAGIFLSTLVIIDLFLNVKKRDNEQITANLLWGGKKWWKNIIVVAFLSFFIFSFDILGFTLSSFLILVLLLGIAGSISWIKILVFAIFTSALSTLFFKIWLQVPFPRGILGM
jgi:hypothetical protein